MKGNEKTLTALYLLLSDELSAINHFVEYSEICRKQGSLKRFRAGRKQATNAMQHSEWLITQIVNCGGTPTVSKLIALMFDINVSAEIRLDNSDEINTVLNYTEAIMLAREDGDMGTADLLTRILKMEEGGGNWEEEQLLQTEEMDVVKYSYN